MSPLDNMDMGDAADRPDPHFSNKDKFWWSTDTKELSVSDGQTWETVAAGGGGGGAAVVQDVSTIVYPLTNPAQVPADGGSANGLAGALQIDITNPSATQNMLVIARAMLPNLNLSSRDGGGQPIPGEFAYTRIGQLTHVESGYDATEADAQIGRIDNANGLGFGAFPSSFITPSLQFMLERTLAPGATANFELSEFPISFNFDDVAIDHIRVGTQEQSNVARARLSVTGVLI